MAAERVPAVEPTAIVGLACRVPGADDAAQFWRNLASGVDSVRDFSRAEQAALGVPEHELDDPEFVASAPVVDDIEGFDARLFGMNAREAEVTDPHHRLMLELSRAALEDAGYDPARFPGRVGVFTGSGHEDYKFDHIHRNAAVMSRIGPLGAVGLDPDYVATLTSYKLDLRGPSLTTHTACSTSLVTVHLACESLRAGDCDLALAGGVHVPLPVGRGYLHVEGSILSPDGRCRPFDASAGGTIWGAGGGVAVLKPLAAALRDGDTVRAVVLATAVNNDGAKDSFAGPSADGQAAVVRRALELAGVDPRSVTYVEAHATGTAVGDPIEVAALRRVFGDSDTDTDPGRGAWCGLGSVKSNIGHLSQAAGIAGVLKTVLALEHRQLPPTIHVRTPNPAIDLTGPFRLVTELSDWDGGDGPRRAAVSSFGVGGTNAHAVLEEAPPPDRPPAPPRDAHLLRLSARTDTALAESVRRLAGHLASAPGADLADVAYTLAAGRAELPHRAVLVARDAADAVAGLADPKRTRTGRAGEPPKVAFLFSGQGSQYAGMGAGLFAAEPVFRSVVEECARLAGLDLGVLLEPGVEHEEVLRGTAVTQPALFAVELGLARLWESWGVVPDAMVGHSVGEYVAATVAGVFAVPDAVRLVAERGRLMQAMPPGSMLAVQRDAGEVRDGLPDGLSVAVVNGPGTCVVAGPSEEVAAFADGLRADGVGCTPLRTSHAFHSAMMEPVLGEFTAAVAAVPRRAPARPFLSNVTGDWVTGEQATDPAYWARHLRSAVLFGPGVATLLAAGAYTLVECGPGRQLAGLARLQARGAPLHSLPGRVDKLDDTTTFATAAAKLWLAGVPVETGRDRPGRRVGLPGYPYQREYHWVAPETAPQPAPEPAPADNVAGPRPVEQWAEVPVWQQVPAPPAGPAPERAWVFAAEETGASVASGLRAAGTEVTELPPGDLDYDELVAAGVPDRIVHAWALAGDPAGTDAAAAAGAQERGFLSLLALTRALAAGAPDAAVRIDVLTAGTEDVTGTDLVRPEHATVAGIARVVPLESPHLAVRHVDLDPRGMPAPDVVREMLHPAADEPAVALRGRRRWQRVAAPVDLPAADTVLRESGRYLVTGGLGGIGLTLAEDLAARHRARLALLSRGGLPDRSTWDGYVARHGSADRTGRAIAAVRRMEAAGAEVLVVAADVTDQAALAAVRSTVEGAYGGLDGIVHAAGVAGGGMAEVKDRAVAAGVLAPKLAGTLALERVFGDLPLDFVVLCSSVTALTGGFGQVDYTAANAFLDAYARSGHGWSAPVRSLNWGGWLDVGMAAETVVPDAFHAATEEAGKERLDSPLLSGRLADGTAVGTLDPAASWVLDGHRIAGVPVLPGTAHLEVLRTAAGPGAVELRDVAFLAPLAVPDGTTARLRVEPLGGGDLRLVTRTAAGDVVHSQGTAVPAPVEERPVHDLAAIRARCRPLDRAAPDGRASTVAFGPQWDCLREHLARDGEDLARIEAGPAALSDLDSWVLHPALLDVATSFGRRGDGSYLPLGYGRVVVRAPLPARFWSHLVHRGDAAGSGLLTADLTLVGDDGRELVAIRDFVLRRIDVAAVGAAVAAVPEKGTAPAGAPRTGIAPADGADAFRRVLSADLGPQVVLSAVPLADVLARERRITAGGVTAGGVAAAGPGSGAGPGPAAEDVVPRTGLERTLAGIWSAVLGVPAVGADDDFFDLGGNSLVAVQLVARVRDAVGVRIPMRTLFDAPTVAGMAAEVARLTATGEQEDSAAAIPRLTRPGGTP
ncbi:MAG TPA: SDR family NAD(P)-dependent oxidoreductase [Mycobacteriales bacterium]